jgi:hypothetical protein
VCRAAYVRLEVRWDAGRGVRPAVCAVLGVSVQCMELWGAVDRRVVYWGSVVSVPCVGLQAVGVSRRCIGQRVPGMQKKIAKGLGHGSSGGVLASQA